MAGLEAMGSARLHAEGGESLCEAAGGRGTWRRLAVGP